MCVFHLKFGGPSFWDMPIYWNLGSQDVSCPAKKVKLEEMNLSMQLINKISTPIRSYTNFPSQPPQKKQPWNYAKQKNIQSISILEVLASPNLSHASFHQHNAGVFFLAQAWDPRTLCFECNITWVTSRPVRLKISWSFLSNFFCVGENQKNILADPFEPTPKRTKLDTTSATAVATSNTINLHQFIKLLPSEKNDRVNKWYVSCCSSESAKSWFNVRWNYYYGKDNKTTCKMPDS